METRFFAPFLAALALPVLAPASPTTDFVAAMGRGVNLGNILESPTEGSWGTALDASDFRLIAEKGFRNVRMPIRWDGEGAGDSLGFDRADRSSPYTVSPAFFARVDSVVGWARQNRLMLVLNDHHHDSLFQDYEHEVPRFLAIWRQIAERYRDLPQDSVAFEILNEPNTQVTTARWNELLDTTLKIIRASNPTRPVVVGTANWGGISALPSLELPDDSALILTLHDYDPMTFTHQGADWTSVAYPVGVAWDGTYYEKFAARLGAETIAAYAASHGNIPVYIGEFGAYEKADMASRARWAEYHARLYESYGFAWAWWEFKAGFGVYDPSKKAWRDTLVDALLSEADTILDPGSPPAGGTDIAKNGDFATGTTSHWSLIAPQGEVALSIDSAVATFAITEAPEDAWGQQLIQSPVVLVAGDTYVLQFDAWADSPRILEATLGMSADPWSGYASASASLSSDPRTFFTSVTPTQTDSAARICFNLGADTGTIHLDNVLLLRWSGTSSSLDGATPSGGFSARWADGAVALEGVTGATLHTLDGRRVPTRLGATSAGIALTPTTRLQGGLYLVRAGAMSATVLVPGR